MNQKLRFDRNKIKIDGLVRTTTGIYEEPLYGKLVKFKTPNFALPLTISPHIDIRNIRLEIDHLLTPHTRFYVTKIFDVDRVLLNRAQAMTQQTLDGKYLDPIFRNFFFNNIMILDFASESLEYTKNLSRYSNSHRLPKEISTLSTLLNAHHKKLSQREFTDFKDKELDKFWKKILIDTKTLNEFEGKFFDEGVSVFGDIILPFTKLIKTASDLVDVKKINEEWLKLNRIHDKPPVMYLLLHPKALRNEHLVSKITDYIKNLKETDILVVKIKNLELTDGSRHILARENLKEILKSIAEKKQKEELLTIALESGEQFWALSLQSFDVVSTSANMYDKETSGGGGISDSGAGYGKAIDEEMLALTEFQSWQAAFNKNGVFPCSHEFCRNKITTMDKVRYFNFTWWKDSRLHNILTLDGWMKMVADSVEERQAGLAFNRLSNSPLRVLTELLLPNYDSPKI